MLFDMKYIVKDNYIGSERPYQQPDFRVGYWHQNCSLAGVRPNNPTDKDLAATSEPETENMEAYTFDEVI
jgi:hypothetical protein